MFHNKIKNQRHINFKEFLEFYAFNYQTARQIAMVHPDTFKRWLNGECQPPAATIELLRLHGTGEPPSIDREWHDWRFVNGHLTCALYRRQFRPSDILMIPCLEQQARELAEIKKNFSLQSKLF